MNPLVLFIKTKLIDLAISKLKRKVTKKVKEKVMLEKLQGKKAYIIAIGLVFTALGSYLSGDASLLETIVIVMNGLGIGALRAGIAKS